MVLKNVMSKKEKTLSIVSNVSKLWVGEQRLKGCNLCRKKKGSQRRPFPIISPFLHNYAAGSACAVTIAAPRLQHPPKTAKGPRTLANPVYGNFSNVSEALPSANDLAADCSM